MDREGSESEPSPWSLLCGYFRIIPGQRIFPGQGLPADPRCGLPRQPPAHATGGRPPRVSAQAWVEANADTVNAWIN